MLSAVNNSQPIQAAQFQFVEGCCQFTYTDNLQGKVIQFTPALFNNGSLPPPVNPAYQLVYPSSDRNMALLLPSEWSNYEAVLEPIDDYNFKIRFKFFMVQDYGNWIGQGIVNNANVCNGGGAVYQNGAFLSFYVSCIGLTTDTAQCDVPVSGNALTTLDYELQDTDGNQIDGYCPNEDLNICVEINGNVNNNIYVAFYREDAISNNSSFVNDLGLSYGLVGSGVTSISSVPATCLKDGNGFVIQNQISKANVVIDGSCLQDGCYRAVIIYNQNGNWQSAKTNPIKVKSDTGVIKTGFECQSIFNGISYDASRVKGISSCDELTLCSTIDQATFNSELDSGTITDYLTDITVEADGSPIPFSGDINKVTSTYKPQTGFSGTVAIRHKYHFEVNGVEFILAKEFQIEYSATQLEVNAVACNEDGNEIGCLCSEDPQNITLKGLPTGDCDAYLLANEVLQPSEAITGGAAGQVQIDCTKLDANRAYKLKLVCGEGVQECPCDTECPPCEPIAINIAVDDESSTEFIDVQINAVGCEICWVWGSNSGSNNDILNLEIPKNFVPTGISDSAIVLTIKKPNGCDYGYTLGGLFDLETFPNLHNGNQTLLGNGTEDCDCECDETDCAGQNIGINWECDKETGEITATSSNTITDTIVSDSGLEYSLDNVNFQAFAGAVTEQKIFLRHVIVTENCGTFTAQEVATCDIEETCINNRLPTCEIVNGLLNIDLTADSFDSNIISDILTICLDGVPQSFDLLNGSYTPVDVSKATDIEIKWNAITDDSCPNVTGSITKTNTTTPADCASATLDCTYDEENGQFIISYSGGSGMPKACLDNGKQFPVPSSPFNVPGEGQLVVLWEIPGCPPMVKVCYDKRTVEICDYNLLLEVLTEICEKLDDNETEVCCTGVQIQCTECTLTAVVECPEGLTPTYLWSTGETTPSIEVEEDGDYSVTVSSPDCPDLTDIYTFEKLRNNTEIEKL